MKTSGPKTLSDSELIDSFLIDQSDSDFNLLYGRYSNKVYSKCLSLLKNEAKAKDAAQEIFVKIFLNLSRFNRKSRFSTWVYSITYNYCIDYIRRMKREKTVLTDEDEGVADDMITEVDDKVLLEIEIERLKIVMDKIPEGDKAVLLMKYKEELSIKEIGEIINKSESAVKMKLKRAKHKASTVYQEIFKD